MWQRVSFMVRLRSFLLVSVLLSDEKIGEILAYLALLTEFLKVPSII